MKILSSLPVNNSVKELISKQLQKYSALENSLKNDSANWGCYQSEFNQMFNSIFGNIMMLEKDLFKTKKFEEIKRLRDFFWNNFKNFFIRGQYISWSYSKPYGYAGDFKIIDDIYQNQATSVGFDRLFDNYFLMSPASIATRNRKEDFKRKIKDFMLSRKNEISILDVASGPCRDVFELINSDASSFEKVSFTCMDKEPAAIAYANNLIGQKKNVNLIQTDIFRLALKKKSYDSAPKYDFIYSTGLFDYLSDELALRLIANFKTLLKPGGVLGIANYLDRYSNTSLHFMELVGDWELVYRSRMDFENVFLKAGFQKTELEFDFEQQGIMQYCFAYNS